MPWPKRPADRLCTRRVVDSKLVARPRFKCATTPRPAVAARDTTYMLDVHASCSRRLAFARQRLQCVALLLFAMRRDGWTSLKAHGRLNVGLATPIASP